MYHHRAFFIWGSGGVTDRTEQLKKLMADHKLSAEDVGELLTRSPQTVRCWRCQWDARTIPVHTLAVLEMKLATREVARD
jgi:hypothetical protein